MTVQTSADRAIQRILAINWEPDDTRTNSHIALLQEYLRRTALWANALNCTDEWPFFDVAAHIYPEIIVNDTYLQKLDRHFSQAPFYVIGIVEKTCKWFLHWQVVKHLPKATQFSLPDPYETLLLLYDRGGIFYTEHGFFYFDDAGVPRGTWKQHYRLSPIVTLEPAALDELDGKFAESR